MWDVALPPTKNPLPRALPSVSCSDVAVELPFTLMHPKPKEEPAHRDGECGTEGSPCEVPNGDFHLLLRQNPFTGQQIPGVKARGSPPWLGGSPCR